MKIRTRLILSFTLLVGIGFYFLVDYILDGLRPRYLEAVEEALVDQAQILATVLETQIKDGRIETGMLREAMREVKARSFSAKIYQLTKTQVDERIFVTDFQGKVIFDSDSGKEVGRDYSQWRDVFLSLRGEYGARATRLDKGNPTTSVLHVAAPIRWEGAILGVLIVAKPTASINFFIQTARPTIIIAGTVAALSAILLGIFLSLWITRPLARLTDYARRVRDQKSAHLPELGSSEIKELGQALDEMREALEGKKYVEEFVQNLTHELKSPLAAVQGAAELLSEPMPEAEREKFLENIREETKRMQEIVERMLELASLQARREIRDAEQFELGNLVGSCMQRLKGQFAERGLQVETRIPSDLQLKGEYFFLEAALLNLLQNALAFSPRGGKIAITGEVTAGQVTLRIEDEGQGIPDFALPKVFDKFFSLPRPDHGKKSSGLGLTFAKEVAELHGGSVQIANRDSGGVQATLTLPLS